MTHRFGLALTAARDFIGSDRQRDSAFMLPVRLRGKDRGTAAYIPADTFWRISTMLEQGLVAFIELSFEPLRYGSGLLESVYFAGSEEDWAE